MKQVRARVRAASTRRDKAGNKIPSKSLDMGVPPELRDALGLTHGDHVIITIRRREGVVHASMRLDTIQTTKSGARSTGAARPTGPKGGGHAGGSGRSGAEAPDVLEADVDARPAPQAPQAGVCMEEGCNVAVPPDGPRRRCRVHGGRPPTDRTGEKIGAGAP